MNEETVFYITTREAGLRQEGQCPILPGISSENYDMSGVIHLPACTHIEIEKATA